MNGHIEKIMFLESNKENILKDLETIKDVDGYSKSQAQNLREYSNQTESVKDLILYIDYQCARIGKEKYIIASTDIKRYIEKYSSQYGTNAMEAIRHLLGAFTRLVIIKEKELKKRKEELNGKGKK